MDRSTESSEIYRVLCERKVQVLETSGKISMSVADTVMLFKLIHEDSLHWVMSGVDGYDPSRESERCYTELIDGYKCADDSEVVEKLM